MKFHPFKLKIFNVANGTVITDIQDFIDNKEIISLLYIECPIINKTLHVGDFFYNEKENKYYIFSVMRCEKSDRFSYGINGFGFVELSFLNNDIENIFFKDYFYKEINNHKFKNMIKNNSLFMGNIFLMKEEKRINKSEFDLPSINKVNSNDIISAIYSDNFNINIGIGDRSFKILEISDRLPLSQGHLDNLLNGTFSIKLTEKKNNVIMRQDYHITSYTGSIYKVKKEKLDYYLDYTSFYDRHRAFIIRYQNERKLKINFNKFVEAINFYKETICVLTDKGIEFINKDREDDILEDYMKLLVHPTHHAMYDSLEEDLNDKNYIDALLNIIS